MHTIYHEHISTSLLSSYLDPPTLVPYCFVWVVGMWPQMLCVYDSIGSVMSRR